VKDEEKKDLVMHFPWPVIVLTTHFHHHHHTGNLYPSTTAITAPSYHLKDPSLLFFPPLAIAGLPVIL
jgi:flavin reductase (DIM6/NTAB) family NADH-FMN oxidoreductase RutF